YPRGIAVDASGDLYIADFLNSRVLEYNTPLAGCGGSFPCVGGSANRVFGTCGDFTGNACAIRPSADSLFAPAGLAFDPSGNLWVADSGASRVLEYNSPLSNSTADLVI